MNKIYLFAFLVAVVSANLAVDIGDLHIPSDGFKCFAQKNVNKVIIQISDENGNTNVDFLTHFTNAKNAEISSVDALVIVNDSFGADSFSTKVANALPSGFNGIVWLRVVNSAQAWTKKTDLRITYFGDLVTAFTQRNLKVGISGEAGTWTSTFGQRRAGSDILKSAPVWYADQDGIQSFFDFSTFGFGTWNEPALKNYQSPSAVCNTRVSSANYFEGDAIQIHQ